MCNFPISSNMYTVQSIQTVCLREDSYAHIGEQSYSLFWHFFFFFIKLWRKEMALYIFYDVCVVWEWPISCVYLWTDAIYTIVL